MFFEKPVSKNHRKHTVRGIFYDKFQLFLERERLILSNGDSIRKTAI